MFFIDEVNSKHGASVMRKQACSRLSAWVFFSEDSAYIFLMGLSGGQNKAILIQ